MTDMFVTKDSYPDVHFKEYAKIRTTWAVKIEGTFHCVTSEGNVASCSDGWLAIDSHGFPYPVNTFEFETTYKPIDHPSGK
jgi:hypothetical protein